VPFPSLKAPRLLAVLKKEPLLYRETRRSGSHRTLESESYPKLTFSFHDNVTIAPGLVRQILVKQVGLTEDEALGLL
jgi:predicted RNA binding protein YcfA (HicA-like mRNA interferase family)